MDAFYASVEQHDDPRCAASRCSSAARRSRGVVAPPPTRRGASAAVGDADGEALRRCPQAIVVPPALRALRGGLARVFEIFRRHAARRGLSLDEAFLDVTGAARCRRGRDIAGAIDHIRRTGRPRRLRRVAAMKFAAKIATDLGKPDGLVVVRRAAWPLPRAAPGAGRRAAVGVGHVTEEALRDDRHRPPSAISRALRTPRSPGNRRHARAQSPRARPRRQSARRRPRRGREVHRRGASARTSPSVPLRAPTAAPQRRAGGPRRHVRGAPASRSSPAVRPSARRTTTGPGAARALLARVNLALPVRLTGISVSRVRGRARARAARPVRRRRSGRLGGRGGGEAARAQRRGGRPARRIAWRRAASAEPRRPRRR